MTRICKAEGCEIRLGAANRSGYCVHHFSRPRGYRFERREKDLARLSEAELADYRLLRRVMRYTPAEAFRAIGRYDLARGDG